MLNLLLCWEKRSSECTLTVFDQSIEETIFTLYHMTELYFKFYKFICLYMYVCVYIYIYIYIYMHFTF